MEQKYWDLLMKIANMTYVGVVWLGVTYAIDYVINGTWRKKK